MHIDFHDATKSVHANNIDLLQRILQFTAKQENVSREAEISINFVDNNEIQVMNRNYRHQNNPTDVISFALQDPVEGEVNIIDREDIPLALGDIVISVEKAQEQAEEYGHSFQRELAFLTIHGFLHLLGYDHNNEENEAIMMKKQMDILEAFQIER